MVVKQLPLYGAFHAVPCSQPLASTLLWDTTVLSVPISSFLAPPCFRIPAAYPLKFVQYDFRADSSMRASLMGTCYHKYGG